MSKKEKFIEILVYAGEKAVSEARQNGKYNDITGNLRSSIGYIVLDNGEQVAGGEFTQASKGTDKESGIKEGKKLAYELAGEYKTGLVLIIVAGMDYAVFVENIDGKEVLSGAVTGTDRFLRETLKKVVNHG